MSAFFEYLICKVCGVKIDAKDYTYQESQTGMCEYCYEEKEVV
jgi:hypothetical protein